MLGVNENASYEQSDLRLAAGDRIVLFTDGLNEAEDADGNDFGDDRLVESVVANRTQSAAALLDSVFGRVRVFTGSRFRDDATLITVAIR